MLKSFIIKIKRRNLQRKAQNEHRWSDILKRYNHLTDGEFIDELLRNYHPPKRKNLESKNKCTILH